MEESKKNVVGIVYQRPWGTYQTLTLSTNYQVKALTIHPDGRLSLQKHFHRSEHWVVVTGNPTITVENKVKVYSANEHVYIPREALHRIENFSKEDSILIEVQVGDYLGEDDIVRIEDVYGRT